MEVVRGALLASLLCLGASCVSSQEPVGSRVHRIRSDEWSGTWLKGDGKTVSVDVLDEANGVLECSMINTDEPHPSLTVFTVQLFEHGDWVFANLQDRDSTKHYWARVWRDDEQTIVWLPSVKVIRQLVEEGVLPGSLVEPAGVAIEGLSENQLTAMTQGKYGIVINLEAPVAFIRIARK